MKGSEDQAVDIPFTGGMGEGAAPFVLNAPFVELAEDCVITKEGAYQRFPGGSNLAIPSVTIGGTRGVSSFDSTVIQHSVVGPQQYNETNSSWRLSNPRGFVPTQVRTDELVTQPYVSVFNPSMALSDNDYELYVWDEQKLNFEQEYGRSWLSKKLAIRDPSGGWTIAPVTLPGPVNAGHQIIAVGTTFLIAYTTSTGFQVSKISESATSISSLTSIVVNAAGGSVVYNFILYNAVHDCVLSTDGSRAYFVVSSVSSTTFRIYTVNTSGLVGSATTGTGDTTACYAIGVDNAKVYVAFTPSAGGVSIRNVTEVAVTTGVVVTSVGSFSLASGYRGLRLRIHGNNNSGIAVAVESQVQTPTTDFPIYLADPSPLVTYVNQMAAFVYVEVGFLPTSDVIASYTAVANRAYAYNFSIGSGFYYEANRGLQIGLTWVDFRDSARTQVVVKDPLSSVFAAWQGNPQTGYYGSLWTELFTQSIPSDVPQDQGGGSPTQKLRLRALARYGWDESVSAIRFTTEYNGAANTNDDVHTNFALNSISKVTRHKFAFPRLGASQAASATVVSVKRCSVDTNPKPPLGVDYGETLFFDGGSQSTWDGTHSYENTPHFPPAVAWVPKLTPGNVPEQTTVPIFKISGTEIGLAYSSITNGSSKTSATTRPVSASLGVTDVVSFYWEYTDAAGVLHRSSTTDIEIALAYATDAAAGKPEYWLNAPGYFYVLPPLSANGAEYANLILCVAFRDWSNETTPKVISKYAPTFESYYGIGVNCNGASTFRTECGQFLLAKYSTNLLYVPGALFDAYTYRGSDTPLYTDGGILQSEASPSPVSITSTRDRLWIISADNRRLLYYSKPLEAGVAPEFNGALTVALPADAGEGVVVLAIDEKPVVLCERGLYVVVGDGPNAAGLQGDFAPQLIQTDTGCKEKNSTAKCDYGAFFQGERGIYLLDRGLSVSLISQGVQDRAQLSINKATAVPKEQQVRFALTNGGILVYHYALKAWTVLNKTAYDATVWDDVYTRVYDPAACKLAASDGTSSADPEGIVTMRIRTCWVKPDKMQGFARFKRVLLLHGQQGYYPTSYGPLTLNTYFNYEDEDGEGGAYVETASFPSAARKPSISRSQVEVRIGRQKAESIKFDIVCPNRFSQGDFVEFYAPISLEGICLVVGTITNTQFRHLPKATKR